MASNENDANLTDRFKRDGERGREGGGERTEREQRRAVEIKFMHVMRRIHSLMKHKWEIKRGRWREESVMEAGE